MGKFVRFVISGLFIIAAYGCVVSESFKIGEELSANKRWDEAIIYYEKSLSDAPGRQDYKDALLRARQQSAKVHFENATRMSKTLTADTIPKMDQVLKEMDIACSLDPDNKEIAAQKTEMVKKRSDLLETIKKLYAQADLELKKENWLEAIEKFKRLNNIFPGYEDTSDKLESASQSAIQFHYKQAIDFGRQERWNLAALSFKTVLDLKSNYLDTADLYAKAKDRDNAPYYTREGSKAVLASDWERAVFMYEKALEYQPDDKFVLKTLTDIKAKASQCLFDESMKAMRQGKLGQAFRKLQLANSYSPSLRDNLLQKEFTNNLCGRMMDRADKYAEHAQWGNSLIWYQMVESLDPNYKNIFHRVQETRDNIKKRIRRSIAVFDFKGPSGSKDAGKIVANKLITFLYKNASGDLRIIERENLESILKELQLGQTGLVDVDAVQKVGKMGGIDTFIMGDVLRFTTEYKDYPSVNQVKVLVDEEEMHNPAFSDWLILHKSPTENDLKAAPPRTIKKRNYQLISFKSGYAKIMASIETSYKLVDTRTGENLFANTVSGKLSKEDKYQDGVPMANISQDLLELPTELDVLDELTNAKISEMGQSVLKHFQSLEIAYFKQAQLQLKRRNTEDAIEKFINAIYDENLKGIATPISKSAKDLIYDLTKDM